MTAAQWITGFIGAPVVVSVTVLVTSIVVWRRRNRAWHGGRWS